MNEPPLEGLHGLFRDRSRFGAVIVCLPARRNEPAKEPAHMLRSSASLLASTPVVLIGVAALALAGCGSGGDGTRSASSSPSAHVSNPPTPRGAADGTNVNACTDGACEIEVTGPTRIPLGHGSDIASLKVTSISAGELSLTAIAASTPTGYAFNTSCEGGASCTTRVDNDKAYITAQAGAKITLNRLRVQVASLSDGSVTLRLSPA